MATTWGDPRILRQIVRGGRPIRDPRVRRIFERFATQIGLVESGGRNLRYGDADSVNFRQERAQGYADDWARTGGPYNTKAIVDRLRNEFLQHYDPGEKSYEVAAQVQRPREDLRGRYQEVAKDAAQILRGVGTPRGGGGQQPYSVTGGTNSLQAAARQMPQGSEGLLPLLQAIGQQPQAPASTPLPTPAFAAGPAMPAGAQAIPSSGPPAPKPDMAQLLSLIGTQGGDVEHQAGVQTDGMAAPGATTRGGRVSGGRVVVDPNADRPGVRTNKVVVNFARQISAISGHPVRIGTGSAHSRLTVNGTQSDHWEGDAADIPASGSRLTRLGQAALIAAGMPKAQARKAKGGIYNLQMNGRRVQVIFHASGHEDHLHVGIR